jgi:hypothetical protein
MSRATAWFGNLTTLSVIEGQRAPRFGNISKVLSLRARRLGGTNCLEVDLFNILEVTI